ncbi:unnamed protein product [Cochlearia groenlandica]
MFYSQCLVSRKGPLGAIWVAAYFFKKLKKSQVKDTHIPSSVDQILQKELDALTYRVLAYLLLGIVRIYSKKVDFLFDDCNRVLINVKDYVVKEKGRERTNVSLSASPSCFSIALPERFELDAFDLGILEDFHGGNVKQQEDITLKGTLLVKSFEINHITIHVLTPLHFNGTELGETESVDRYSMERFDLEEDLMCTIQETFFTDHNEIRRESFGHDMDIDTEYVNDATEEASVRVVEAEPLHSKESSKDHQDVSRHSADPESDDMLEDIRRTQEEDTARKTICTIIRRLEDPQETSDTILHSDRHMEDSESEKHSVETSWEKMRHDGSFPSECKSPEASRMIEEQHSGATRSDAEKEIPETSTLERPELGSVSETSDLAEGVEKRRGHSDGEMTASEMFHGSHKELSVTSELNQGRLHNGTEKGFLSDMTFSEEGSVGFKAKDTPVNATPEALSQLRNSEGETSHQFLIIPTPTAKESARVSRKRKCLIDDEVIIPNKIMKNRIEDSSTLISKRRKIPLTDDYPERKIKRVTDPSRSFLEPLIPYGSLELQLLFSQPIKLKEPNTADTPKAAKTARRMESSSSEQTDNGREVMETPQASALAELRVTVPGNNTEVSGIADQREIAPETPVRTSEQTNIAPETPVVCEQVEIAPETPMRESMSIPYFKDPETCEKETRPASSFTYFDEHPSGFSKDRDLDDILINDEQVNENATEDLRQETWSARTRSVVKFLEKKFMEQKEKEEEEKVSLLQVCRGRTQKESARLFYETLMLKTKGYLEVKQDHPYSDIILTRFTRQQEAC